MSKASVSCQHSIWALVNVPLAQLPVQHPADGLEKASEIGSDAWSPVSHIGDPDVDCGFSLTRVWPLWRTGEWMEDLCLSLSVTLFK